MAPISSDKLSDYLQDTPVKIPEPEIELAETTKDPKVMDELAGFWDWRIRSRIAKKPNINPDTLKKLSKDRDYLVRISVLGNETITIEMLQIMTKDEDKLVSKCAKMALKDKLDGLFLLWK